MSNSSFATGPFPAASMGTPVFVPDLVNSIALFMKPSDFFLQDSRQSMNRTSGTRPNQVCTWLGVYLIMCRVLPTRNNSITNTLLISWLVKTIIIYVRPWSWFSVTMTASVQVYDANYRAYSSVRKQLDFIIEFAGYRTKQPSIKQLTALPLISQKTVFKRAVLSCF